MKKLINVPRGSSKSYVQKILDEQTKKINHSIYTSWSNIKLKKVILTDEMDLDMFLDNNLVFCNDNHISYSTLRRMLTACNFDEIKDDFKVHYVCPHCEHNQYITNTNLLLSQFIMKDVQAYAHMRITCRSCGKSATVPSRIFIKKIICNYTQEPIEKYNLSFPKLISKLKQVLDFDCMLNGKTNIVIVSDDSLKDLIYD